MKLDIEAYFSKRFYFMQNSGFNNAEYIFIKDDYFLLWLADCVLKFSFKNNYFSPY